MLATQVWMLLIVLAGGILTFAAISLVLSHSLATAAEVTGRLLKAKVSTLVGIIDSIAIFLYFLYAIEDSLLDFLLQLLNIAGKNFHGVPREPPRLAENGTQFFLLIVFSLLITAVLEGIIKVRDA